MAGRPFSFAQAVISFAILLCNAPQESKGNCGKTSNFPPLNYRIVGGRVANPGEFPWQVSLQRQARNGRFAHMCGGSILNPSLVLTASHCVDGVDAGFLRVVAGIHSVKGGPYQQVSAVKKLAMHEDYNPKIFHNDIALLYVSPPFNMSGPAVGKVCLPPPMAEFGGTAIASGWGSIKDGSSKMSPLLRAVTLPLLSDDTCQQVYGHDAVTSDELCAGVEQGGLDTCQGDSGGPLVVYRMQRAFQVGVVSWGLGCARVRSPGVYTQVSHYISWIQSHAQMIAS